jgi:hypothetical protein
MPRDIHVTLTPAQLRAVNAGLALLEAEVDADERVGGIRPAVIARTRRKIWDAMINTGTKP